MGVAGGGMVVGFAVGRAGVLVKGSGARAGVGGGGVPVGRSGVVAEGAGATVAAGPQPATRTNRSIPQASVPLIETDTASILPEWMACSPTAPGTS